MRILYFPFWITLLVTALLGCDSAKNQGPPHEMEQELTKQQKRAIVVAIDYSGSYESLSQAKAMICYVITHLNPGDLLYCRAITSSSYLDNSKY